jgi:TPR repeat protein
MVCACELGNSAGCHNSGNAYEYGQFGANKDYNKARDYYLIAADKGFIQSQYNLGSLYSNQYFNDDVEGFKWMLLAEKSAKACANVPLCKWMMEDPPGHRSKLKNRMTKNQIAEAEQLANQWKPKQ